MRLIVNADDFGLTVNVSRGIMEGMRRGIITDTSAIVNADDFSASAELARENGITEMGIHCLLTMGRPVLPKSQVSSLVDKDGRFYTHEVFRHKEIDICEAEAELEAQIQKLLRSGLKLNHIDSHHGIMGKSKEMTELFCSLSVKYGVPIRNEWSREENSDEMQTKLNRLGIRAADLVYFNHGTPYHTVPDVLRFLEDALASRETVEIGCHPGHSDDVLRRISVLNDDREKELETVTDQRLIDYICENGIELIPFSEL